MTNKETLIFLDLDQLRPWTLQMGSGDSHVTIQITGAHDTRPHPPGGPSHVPARSGAVGTACDGVVHSNASAIQLHPIGLRFGLDAERDRKGRSNGREEGTAIQSRSMSH